MSFVEKPPVPGRLLLDDTVPLTAVIEASQNLQSHTVSLDWKGSVRSETRLGAGAVRNFRVVAVS